MSETEHPHQSPAVVEFDALLAPVPGDSPTGADLRADDSPGEQAVHHLFEALSSSGVPLDDGDLFEESGASVASNGLDEAGNEGLERFLLVEAEPGAVHGEGHMPGPLQLLGGHAERSPAEIPYLRVPEGV